MERIGGSDRSQWGRSGNKARDNRGYQGRDGRRRGRSREGNKRGHVGNTFQRVVGIEHRRHVSGWPSGAIIKIKLKDDLEVLGN
jgi:hypothetical protein